MTKTPLFTRPFLIIMVENFCVYFTYYLLIVVIALYAKDHFQASPSMAGLSAGIFIIGALFGRLFAGSTIESMGHKRMLYLSILCYVIMTLAYFVVSTLFLLILIRFLHGVAFGMTSTATGAIAAEIIPNERRGEGTGYYALSMTLATAIGPLLGINLADRFGFRFNFAVCAMLLGVALLAAIPLHPPKQVHLHCSKKRDNAGALHRWIENGALKISFVTLLVCFAYSSILAFLSSYAKSIHLGSAGSVFFAVYACSILISRPLTGRLFDRRGENAVIYPTMALFCLALVVLAFANTGFLILLSAVLTGFSYGNFFAAAQALAVRESPDHRRALATSTIFIFADVGAGMGPFLLGLFLPWLQYRGLYLAMATLVIMVLFLYYGIHGRTQAYRGKTR